jgi:hypothetical protein
MPPKNQPRKEQPKRQESLSKAAETSSAALQTAAGGADAATEQLVHEAAEAGRRGFEAAAGSATRAGQDFFDEGHRSAEAWRTGAEQARGGAERAAGLTADASARLTQGVQEATAVVTDLAQESLRRNVETAQLMLRCRTFEDVVRVQSDWMRGNIDLILSRGTRLSAIATGLALGTLDAAERGAAAQRR